MYVNNLLSINQLKSYSCALQAAFLALALVAPDAPAAEQRTFDQVSLEEGLSQSIVKVILQDSQGFLWFGTEDGLNRYDGYGFTVFRHDPADPNSLGYNDVITACEDGEGRLWVGTFHGGLSCYDQSAGRWVRYQHDPDDPFSLPDDNVNAVAHAPGGYLWVGTDHGLARLDPRDGTFTRYFHDPEDGLSLPDDEVISLLVDGDGMLWVGSHAGLARCRPGPEDLRFELFAHDPTDPGSLGSGCVLDIFQDTGGRIWVGTNGGGLARFDPESETFHRYGSGHGTGGLSDGAVSSICEDTRGRMWLGTYGGGLNRLDPESGAVTVFRGDPDDPQSLPQDAIRSVLVDDSGVLWAGTYGSGLARTLVENKAFDLVKSDPADPRSLSTDIVWNFCEDGRGELWVGTHGGGLDRFGPDHRLLAHYRHDPLDPASLSSDIVRFVLEDSHDRLWVATHGGGLNLMDRDSGRFIRFRNDPDDPRSLSSDFLRTVFEDQGGDLWVGTYGGGLERFEGLDLGFTHYRHDPDDPTTLSNDVVRIIHEDPDEAGRVLWIGTEGGGLNRFDRETGAFTAYRNIPGEPASLSENHVFSIHETGDDILWIGTYAGGLNRFDRATGLFSCTTMAAGLPSNAVYGILEDDQGHLWLSTNYGLARFDPRTGTSKNYDAGDGLQSNEFNGGAYHRGPSGKMYFGGIGGFNVFDPVAITDNRHPPHVVITDFLVGNRSVTVGEDIAGHTLLDRPITHTRGIDLHSGHKVVGFEFAALHFASPLQNRYATMLEGFEDRWNDIGQRPFTTYTNLPPGRYTLRVKAANSDGVWNEEGASLDIVVHPPFWGTAWFQTMAGTLVVGIALGLHLLRLRSFRYRNLRLKQELAVRKRAEDAIQKALAAERETSQLKNEFLANISHEFRTPMNGILGMTQLTLETDLDQEQRTNLIIVKSSAEQLLDIMNNVFDFSRIEAGTMDLARHVFNVETLVDDTLEPLRRKAVAKGLGFSVRWDGDQPAQLQGDPACLQQVLRQVAGNAVEYTETGEVEIAWRWRTPSDGSGKAGSGGQLSCEVRDTGIGIPARCHETIFESFRQVDGSFTRRHGGTGIGLAMCRKLLHLMKGSIRLESTPGKGSVFTFEAPFSIAESGTPSVETAQSIPTLIAAPDGPSPSPGSTPGTHRLRILLVEDVAINQKVASLMLRKAGHHVTVAGNGVEALEQLDRASFDLVLMDIQMPVMNGFEATARIRAAGAAIRDLPIIAVTAHTLEGDRERCLEAGMNGYVPKPIKAADLLEAIEAVVAAEAAPVPETVA